ncbi:transcription elongation factor, mitochondrial [Octopus sinensis]|uniref:Transcription elongation factor, mitochondrial n=1 Tax=Octopus sinensis TaxID=2607531 RepID=A0A6P7TEJ7_9MOLL|nr:transcription elongation factor, mitochondrial [Octopus sinensis]
MAFSFRNICRTAWRTYFRDISNKNISVKKYSKASTSESTLFDSFYSDDERKNILDCFNKASEIELLATRHLNKIKTSSVISHREQFGNFSTLNQISKVPGLSFLELQKLFNTLRSLNHEKMKELVPASMLSPEVTRSQPNMTKQISDSITSLVALDIQTDRITWLKMSRNLDVVDWNQTMIFNKLYMKYDVTAYFEKIHNCIENLPKASIYTLENKTYRYPSLRVVPFVVSLRTIESMLVTMLNHNYNVDKTHRVYTIRPNAINRLFNLSIGGERVSGQHIFRDIINHKRTYCDLDVNISRPLSDRFFQYDTVQQEKITCCLLQALSFYKLIILNK